MTYNVRIIRWKTLIEMRFTYPHLTILCKLILFYVRWQWLRLLWQHLHNTTHTQSTLVLLLACLPACLFHFGTHAYHNWENMGLAACWHRYCRSTIPATYVPCFIYKGFVVFFFSFFPFCSLCHSLYGWISRRFNQGNKLFSDNVLFALQHFRDCHVERLA